MFVHNINPVLLKLGSLEIRYYGIIYALAFLIGYYYIKRESEKRNLKLDADSLITYLIIGTLIGARLFEIIFYNPSFYFSNPLEIFALWHGGLSFHGGLVGGLVASIIFCRKYKIRLLELGDILAVPLAFGLFIGRIANFINGELYGYPTNLSWGVDFGDGIFRHPTQIYESLKNLFIFFILLKLKKKEHKEGYPFFVFLPLYGLIRFFIEFLQVPENYLLGMPTGQLFSALMFITGIYFLTKSRRE